MALQPGRAVRRFAWDRPEIWGVPHGHFTWIGARGLTGRVLAWLLPRTHQRSVSVMIKWSGLPRWSVRRVQAKGNALYKCCGRRCLVFEWNAPPKQLSESLPPRLSLRMLRNRRKYELNRIVEALELRQ